MINSSSDAAGTDLAQRPEMTPEERAVLSAHIVRRKQKRPSPRVKLVEKAGSSIELSADHPILKAIVISADNNLSADWRCVPGDRSDGSPGLISG